ncbi:hypothetical protein IFR05_007106 [Cadophora sp. M221]|nr:hypothetical protein IFR05_007106 [Cadophora sp. M221]
MATSEQPQILLLCLSFRFLFDEQYASLIDSISQSAQIKRPKSVNGAIKYLDSNTPKVIIATNEGLTKPENAAVTKIHFVADFEPLFTSFGLAWKRGNYERSTFEVSTLPRGVTSSSLPSAFSMKALHVREAKPQEKIFVPIPGGKTQSMVFAPRAIDQTQAAIVGARIGNGYLAYAGDVNGEEESERVILALCGF